MGSQRLGLTNSTARFVVCIRPVFKKEIYRFIAGLGNRSLKRASLHVCSVKWMDFEMKFQCNVVILYLQVILERAEVYLIS